MIGVFDSGFGGLTVLKELTKVLPEYDYMYLGDSARAPYGNHSHDSVLRFTREGIDFLLEKGCKLIIIACNTASALVLKEIQEDYLRKPGITDKKILGVLRPLAEYAGANSISIGVIGTRGTVNSKSYKTEIQKIAPNAEVYQRACPLLVPLIEEDYANKPETISILKKYLKPLKSYNVDTLILGCTHYPVLLKKIKKIMGKRVKVPNPGLIVAKSLEEYLERHKEISELLTKKGTRQYLTTDSEDRFFQIGYKFYPLKKEDIIRVKIT
ncbi:glutamate racemase [Candidatus Peregrinibacteria bacterium]|nr:glutamate racemase [Candidatus Peregrinibacteria bacterium]